MSADRHTTEDCLVIKALLRTSILGAKRTVRKSTCAFNEGIETEEERKRTHLMGWYLLGPPVRTPSLIFRFGHRLPSDGYWVAGNKN